MNDPGIDSATEQRRLVAALARSPATFGAECARVEWIETHISHVLLTGRYAFKIKKPVALGFLDFGTLALRRHFCAEELRLNRRLAPALYIEVVPITGAIDAPVIGGDGPSLEYAVKMRQFAQDALASRVMARGALETGHVDTLATMISGFHQRIAVAPANGPYGTPEIILDFARQNFAQTLPAVEHVDQRPLVELAAWTDGEFAARAEAFRLRQRQGFVRECHGDLHLGNIAFVDGAITVFDGIEFNEHLRWIDVASEVAFLAMDLEDRGRPDFAHRFLDAWLAASGDYASVAVLRFYLAYRALVRAKVAALRGRQLARGAEHDAVMAEFRAYVGLARRYARPHSPALIITRGLAGSGKTTATQALVETTGAIRVRTDVERKRLAGLAPVTRSGSALEAGLYAREATEATYRRALDVAATVISAGEVAVVDGAFLKRWQRDMFRALAAARGVPFALVSFAADDATLRARIGQRAAQGADASEADIAVLDHQIASQEPLVADEQADVVAYDGGATNPWQALLDRLKAG